MTADSIAIKLLPQKLDKTQTSRSFHLGLEFHRFGYDGGSIDNLSARINQLNVACEMRHGGMCNVAISEMYYTVPFLQIIVSIRSFSVILCRGSYASCFPIISYWFCANFYIFNSILNRVTLEEFGAKNIKFANICYHLIKILLKNFSRFCKTKVSR